MVGKVFSHWGARVVVCMCAAGLFCACNRPAEHARRLVDRGTALVEAEQYEEALKLFRMALDVDPQYEEAYLQMALLFDTYLHDTSNAVAAYEQYVRVAKNETMRENARRWLESARQNGASGVGKMGIASVRGVGSGLEQELLKRDMELEAVRRQTAERYEGELQALQKELQAARARIRTLENENVTLRSAGVAASRAELLSTVASNRQVIAALKKALAEKEEALREAAEGQQVLQAMVTNLQAELAMRDEGESVVAAFTAATNQLAELRRALAERTKETEQNARLLAEERARRGSLEEELARLKEQYAALQRQYARAEQRERNEVSVAQLQPVTAAGTRSAGQVNVPAVRAMRTDAVAQNVARGVGAHVVVPVAAESAQLGRVYTVQVGDSLMKIARDVYGDANRWTVIFNANRDVLERPNQLRVGQVLRIP